MSGSMRSTRYFRGSGCTRKRIKPYRWPQFHIFTAFFKPTICKYYFSIALFITHNAAKQPLRITEKLLISIPENACYTRSLHKRLSIIRMYKNLLSAVIRSSDMKRLGQLCSHFIFIDQIIIQSAKHHLSSLK